MKRQLWHGGVPGLRRGSRIVPGMAHHKHIDGCPICAAHAAGVSPEGHEPATPDGWVYATSDKAYARFYASKVVGGDLYQVRLLGDVERSTEDMFPAWRGRRAVVVRVVERGIVLTPKERRHLFLRWGGTDEELAEMYRAARDPHRLGES